MAVLIGFLAGAVLVLASWCVWLIHRRRDLRQLLNILTQTNMSNMAKQLIELDKKHPRPLT